MASLCSENSGIDARQGLSTSLEDHTLSEQDGGAFVGRGDGRKPHKDLLGGICGAGDLAAAQRGQLTVAGSQEGFL